MGLSKEIIAMLHVQYREAGDMMNGRPPSLADAIIRYIERGGISELLSKDFPTSFIFFVRKIKNGPLFSLHALLT